MRVKKQIEAILHHTADGQKYSPEFSVEVKDDYTIRKSVQDFTEGSITKQVIRFTTPIMLGNVLMSVYGIINMIWVGRLLGHEAVAAASATLPIIMLMPAFLIGLGMATNVLIAQAFRRKDTATLKKILCSCMYHSQ